MLHQHHEVRVEAPVEDVWAFCCDTSRWHEWLPRGEFTDFTGPVDQVGTTYVVTVRFPGYTSVQPMEIVEVEPLRLIHEHNDDWPKDNYYRFEPDGAATRFAIESDYEWPSRMPGFLKDLMNRVMIDRQHRKVLANFKALAEAKVPAHA
jgi:uncharacterized protein YndB with AHSA1/START domain